MRVKPPFYPVVADSNYRTDWCPSACAAGGLTTLPQDGHAPLFVV